MKILRFPSYYTPEVVSSSHLGRDLEEAYVKAGFEIEIYAPTPTRGVSEEVYKKYKKIPYEEYRDGKVKVHRFPMRREKKNSISRALRYSSVLKKQKKFGFRAEGVDIVLGSSTPPTLGLTCAKVAKTLSKKYGRKVPFVYTLQDVFPDSLATTGLAKPGSFLYKMGTKIANKIYESADLIITISEDIKKNIMAKGVPEEKIRVIYNWIDTSAVKPVPKEENKLFDELGLSHDTFKIVYAGNLGMAQGVDVLLDAAELMSDESDVEFIIFGRGAREGEIKARAEKLSNVRVLPLMPEDRIPEVYSLGDACAVTCRRGTGAAGVPSKTWSIMACGTPLLVAFDKESELADIINRSGAGLVSEPEDASELVENIKKLKDSHETASSMCVAARKYAEEFASREIATAKYVEIIKSFVKDENK